MGTRDRARLKNWLSTRYVVPVLLVLVAALSLLVIILLLPSRSDNSYARYLIVPGEAVGPVRIGMNHAEALGVLSVIFGKEAASSPDRTFKTIRVYRLLNGDIWLLEFGERVTMIQVRSPRFRTKGGLRVGSHLSEALQEFGKPYFSRSTSDGEEVIWTSGLMALVHDGRIRMLQVADLSAGGR